MQFFYSESKVYVHEVGYETKNKQWYDVKICQFFGTVLI